jgi:hypothetical protein
MRDKFKKWIYNAHITEANERRLVIYKGKTDMSFNEIINLAIEQLLKDRV